jgi:hypothetical protein
MLAGRKMGMNVEIDYLSDPRVDAGITTTQNTRS